MFLDSFLALSVVNTLGTPRRYSFLLQTTHSLFIEVKKEREREKERKAQNQRITIAQKHSSSSSSKSLLFSQQYRNTAKVSYDTRRARSHASTHPRFDVDSTGGIVTRVVCSFARLLAVGDSSPVRGRLPANLNKLSDTETSQKTSPTLHLRKDVVEHNSPRIETVRGRSQAFAAADPLKLDFVDLNQKKKIPAWRNYQSTRGMSF